jgi:FkbM family methyltransferase
MKQILIFLLNHPISSKKPLKALFRFFYWQFAYRLLNKEKLVFSVTEKSKMVLRPGLAGASGNYYCGLLEFNDMAFCLHFLRREDTFFDVGANVGIYTIIASGHVGCPTVAFEPDQITLLNLKENLKLNGIENIVSIQEKAVGENIGKIKFTVAKDTINHVISQNDSSSDFHEVDMTYLDHFKSSSPKMIKIDVEGFEWNVLKGAKELLADPNLDVILIEINGSGKYFNVDDNSLHLLLTDSGFQPFSYDPFNRKLSQLETFGNLNTIYIRNESLVKNRLINAESFITMGMSI